MTNSSLASSYSYLESKIGGNIKLSDDYIKGIISAYEETHNSSDLYFYLLMILPLIFFNYFPELNLQKIARNFGGGAWNIISSILICIVGFSHIGGSYYLTVPVDNNTNTKILKELVYPLLVIIGIFIFSLVTSEDKSKHLLFSSILIIPAIAIVILNTISMFEEDVSKVIGILNGVFIPVITIILVIYFILFQKGKGPESISMFYSFPLWSMSFLILGRFFKVINKVIINYNASNGVLKTNTDTSTALNDNITSRLNTIIEDLDIKMTASELYNVLTSYKLSDESDLSTWDKYSSSIYYFIGSALNLVFYWLFGNAINFNIKDDVVIDRANQLAFPILGFNMVDKGNKIIGHLLGTVSTKILITGFTNNNTPTSGIASSSVINVLLTGLKFSLAVLFGKKYNKWYEYIVDENNPKWQRYLLRCLYAGLDIRKSSNQLNKNTKKGIVNKDFYFEGKDTVVFMILYFLFGGGISTFSSMDYFTNVPLTSFILTCCKYISVVVIMIIYFKHKDSLVIK